MKNRVRALVFFGVYILMLGFIMVGCAPAKNKATDTGKKILFYRNPMNPAVQSPVPLKDEMGMDYIPVYEKEAGKEGGISVSPEEQQLIGAETGVAAIRNLSKEINTVGTIAYDPDLFVAQEEFISAIKLNDEGLIAASKRRLKLLGMSDSQISKLEVNKAAQSNLVLPENVAMVYATIYEYELGSVKEGLAAKVESAAYPGDEFAGKIISIPEVLDSTTRSVKARIQVGNPNKKLKPDMFVNVKIIVPLGAKLSVPEESVINTGDRSVVVVTDGKGYYYSRDVKIGQKAEGYYVILSGLQKNDKVVTSGNFLIDSESRLKSAIKSDHKHGGN